MGYYAFAVCIQSDFPSTLIYLFNFLLCNELIYLGLRVNTFVIVNCSVLVCIWITYILYDVRCMDIEVRLLQILFHHMHSRCIFIL